MQPQRLLINLLLFVASLIATSNAEDTNAAARCVSLADTDEATLLTLHLVLQAHLKPPTYGSEPQVVCLYPGQQSMVDYRNSHAKMHRTAGQHRGGGKHHEDLDR